MTLKLRLGIICIAFSGLSLAKNISINILKTDDTPAKNVVVYITPLSHSQPLPDNMHPLIIAQNNKEFIPYITVMQKNQKITFKNQDDITHHIYSTSKNNRFDFKIKAGKKNSSIIFNSTGEVAMGCNRHDWMSGYLLVVDTPYYQKTDHNGQVSFNDVPPTQFQVTIWHPQLNIPKNVINRTIDAFQKDQWTIKLSKEILAIPEQQNSDEFDFLEGY
jgi:plastocyanin